MAGRRKSSKKTAKRIVKSAPKSGSVRKSSIKKAVRSIRSLRKAAKKR